MANVMKMTSNSACNGVNSSTTSSQPLHSVLPTLSLNPAADAAGVEVVG